MTEDHSIIEYLQATRPDLATQLTMERVRLMRYIAELEKIISDNELEPKEEPTDGE